MSEPSTFASLGLGPELLKTITDLGYEAPTPIQERTIPVLLAGRDVIGQAQTGTGKTAAFALPMLSRIDVNKSETQGLVMAPTRELAMQVAEAIHSYAHGLGPLVVLPVYGGAPIFHQLKRLERGVHIVVGTPGRLIDMLDRKALRLDRLRMVVLDEADEMLKMGFIEDVERILGDAPADRQTALFSATMPDGVLRIARRHLRNPERIELEHKTSVAATAIAQRFLNINEGQKLEVLTQILELEESEATLIFRRTKNGAAELAEKLQGRGFAAEPMHGDMNQSQRESVIRRLRAGQVEVVVATDVAARGLDVEQIEHVINYDVPNDVEAYVHRIGRTGRAGRSGVATLFVTPRERRMMREIERFTGMAIKPMKMPTRADVAAKRVDVFKDSLRESLQEGGLDLYLQVVEELVAEGTFELAEVAAAAAKLANGARGLVDTIPSAPATRSRSEAKPAASAAPPRSAVKPLAKSAAKPAEKRPLQTSAEPSRERIPSSVETPIAQESPALEVRTEDPLQDVENDTAPIGENDPLADSAAVPAADDAGDSAQKKKKVRAKAPVPDADFDPDAPVRLRMEVGRRDGIRPADVVGSIANEAGISGRDIGPIDIRDDVTFVSIPAGSVDLVLDKVGRAKFRGRPVNLRIADADDDRLRPKPNPEDRRPPRATSDARPSRPPYGDRKPVGGETRGPKRDFREDRPSRDDDRRPPRSPYAARGGPRPGPGGPKRAFRPGAGSPPRKFGSDRPPRDDDRRPPRAPYGDRGGPRPGPGGPKREFRPGAGAPPRKFSSDRPARDDDRRPARAPYGDRGGARPGPGGPKREFRPAGPRPSRPRDDDRPPRRDASAGARPAYGKRPFTKSTGGPPRRGPGGPSRGPGGPKRGKK